MDDRLNILGELYEVAALTSSESFRGKVQKAAERYGYSFPLSDRQ
jgi:hypothetical protein